MAELGNSAHIYRLEEGTFRLTFVHATAGGASVLSEIGDFTRWQLKQWLEERLHPATNFEELLKSIESQTESTVAVGTVLLRTHFEDGQLVKSPPSIEDVCQWMGEYQQRYFDGRKITIVAAMLKNSELKGTACFSPTMPDGGSVIVSSELSQFPNALRISLLHELIHANLSVTGKHDPDNEHGDAFQSEVKRLMSLGAYDNLV